MAINSYKKPPELNETRRFPDNMQNALSLLYMAKEGKKGNKKEKRYAVPAFNVTTFQGINAAFSAFEMLGSSGLLAFSNSSLKHFGRGDAIFGLEIISNYVATLTKKSKIRLATHLDHGDYITDKGRKVVQSAVEHLTSVMADNSTDHVNKTHTEIKDNIGLTREVVNIAHPIGVSVEGELGVLAGEEDEDTKSEFSSYTNPEELERFLLETGVLMLAPTIGTMHGPNKGKPGDAVKLNIDLAHNLLNIADKIDPRICFVLHGASTLYEQVTGYAQEILEKLSQNNGSLEKWKNFVGTDWNQVIGLIEVGFAKINTDTENRQTYLASLLGAVEQEASKIDIRYYDNICTEALTQSYLQKLIMAGNYGVWYEPKIDVNKFRFDLSKKLQDVAVLLS